MDTFIWAGHHTSGSTLATALFEIGHHPDVQEKLHDEVDSVFGHDDDDTSRPVTNDDLKKLTYLDMVLKESSRLHPGAPLIARQLANDFQFGKYLIPAGTVITILINQLHRDETIYPEPEKFDPLRFTPQAQMARLPFAFIPFSGGVRSCVGQKFAQLEMKIVITNILRNFSFKTLGAREDFEQDYAMVLGLKSPIKIKFSRR